MEIKSKLTADFSRVNVFIKNEKGDFIPAGYKWMKVRHNAAIPSSHMMFK